MRINLNKWIYNEQKKHRLCACGCGREIIIKKHHHTKGIPKYYNKHKTKLMRYETVTDWVKDQQGKHFCQCGCGEKITIKKWHHKKCRGIPTHIYGHVSEKTKNKNREWHTGIKHTNQTKVKMSQSRVGRIILDKTKKKISDNKKISQFGDKNPSWNGGSSFEPYCHKFNEKLKERIRDRDNRTCQGCGVKENGTKLSIHHIHYDKENCYPDLIAVCRSCNSKANSIRNWYEIYYMRKLLFNKTGTSVYNIESELEIWNYGCFI